MGSEGGAGGEGEGGGTGGGVEWGDGEEGTRAASEEAGFRESNLLFRREV